MAYRGLPKNATTLDPLLRHVLACEGFTMERWYRALNEGEKSQIASGLVNRVFQSVKTKSLQVDYSLVEATKGDVTKLRGYEDLEQSLLFLAGMRSREPKAAPPEISQLQLGLENVRKYRDKWRLGFEQEDEIVVLLYNNLVFSLVTATAFLVSSTIEYAKDPMGYYGPTFKKNLDRSVSANLHFANVEKFNSYVTSGKIDQFFSAALGAQQLGPFGAAVAVGAGIVTGVMLVVWMVREMVYSFFWARVTVSTQLKQLGEFLALNAAAVESKDKRVRDRQESIAKKLMELADKIGVDQKVAGRKAAEEISKEDRENAASAGPSSSQGDNNIL